MLLGLKNEELVGASVYSLPGLKMQYDFVMNYRERMEAIESIVLSYFEVSRKLVWSRTRKRPIVNCRHIIMYLLRKHTKMSLLEIGKACGGRDHTTVIHAIESVRGWMQTDEQYKNIVDLLDSRVECKPLLV